MPAQPRLPGPARRARQRLVDLGPFAVGATIALLLGGLPVASTAQPTTAAQLLAEYTAAAGAPPSPARGH